MSFKSRLVIGLVFGGLGRPQEKRFGNSLQMFSPKSFGLRQVSLLQPGDIVSERMGRFQLQLLTLAKSLVERENLFEERLRGPSIDQEMVPAQNKSVISIGCP